MMRDTSHFNPMRLKMVEYSSSIKVRNNLPFSNARMERFHPVQGLRALMVECYGMRFSFGRRRRK